MSVEDFNGFIAFLIVEAEEREIQRKKSKR
jgi:hypothetical protein